MAEKEIFIFDTDMDTDCDDVGALVMLLKYAKKGKIDLKAIVTDAPSVGGAPICELLCNYYGVKCDIGAIYEKQYSYDNTERYRRYRNSRASLPQEILYNRALLPLINKKDEDYLPSYQIYRKALASCPDQSVTIVAVGFYTAIEELFNSEADRYSPLNGFDLFSRKVKRVISMGDWCVKENGFNFWMDLIGAEAFINRLTCPIYFSGDGENMITGYDFADKLSSDNPMRKAYEIYNGGPNKGRMSWDLVVAYFALGIDESVFDVRSKGRIQYNPQTGEGSWISDGRRNDYEIKVNIPPQQMAERLELLLTNQ